MDLLDDLFEDSPPAEPTKLIENSFPVLHNECIGLPLYLDIETVPDESRLASFDLDELPKLLPESMNEDLPTLDEIEANGIADLKRLLNGKNPNAAWLTMARDKESGSKKPRKGVLDLFDEIESQGVKIAAAAEDRRKLLSVTPEYCRIVAVGWAFGDNEPQAWSDATGDTEVDLLASLLDVITKLRSPILGYNVLGFDLNVIFVRAAIKGLKLGRMLDTKPWGRDVIDLMQKRFPKGPAMKLKQLAKLYQVDVPAGDVDGSQVADLIKTDPELVRKYVMSDIVITRELAKKWQGLFW